MSDPRMDDFVQMSALLTGFAAGVLAPQLDPLDLKTVLFDFAQERSGKAFDELLAQYAKLSGGKPVSAMSAAERQSIGDSLLGLSNGRSSGSDTALTAQAVMKAWYLGYWYQPFDLGTFETGEQTVISDQAYIHGLAWQSMQSKAMGFSTLTFGYWDSPPAALDDFTGQPIPAAGGNDS